jgi:glutamyl-tRNA synthetase
LGITYSQLTYTSDYFPKIFELLKGLIEKGLAYVDNTPVEKMREERTKKIESVTRNFTVEQNLAIFEKLLAGEAD